MLRKRPRLRRIQRCLAQLQHFTQLEFALEPVQRPQHIPLHVGEITTQRILRKQIRMPRLNALQALRSVIAETWIKLKILRQLADFLRLFDQPLLKA
ncbi:hypothetical protein D3C81_2049710 [compost metagenome]